MGSFGLTRLISGYKVLSKLPLDCNFSDIAPERLLSIKDFMSNTGLKDVDDTNAISIHLQKIARPIFQLMPDRFYLNQLDLSALPRHGSLSIMIDIAVYMGAYVEAEVECKWGSQKDILQPNLLERSDFIGRPILIFKGQKQFSDLLSESNTILRQKYTDIYNPHLINFNECIASSIKAYKTNPEGIGHDRTC